MSAAPSTAPVEVPGLRAALAAVRSRLESRGTGSGSRSRGAASRRKEARAADRPAPHGEEPLAVLVERFSLSAFERDLLVMCAGVELDASFAALVARMQGQDGTGGPTFGLALATLEAPHWSALAPASALRFWRLVELQPGAGVTTARLRLEERVLHYLAGVSYLEPRLQGVVEPVLATPDPAPSQVAPARRAVEAWQAAGSLRQSPVLQLEGDDPTAHRTVAGVVAGTLGLRLFRLRAAALPADPEERGTLLRLWEREAMLERAALLAEISAEDPDEVRERLRAFLVGHAGLAVVSTSARLDLAHRPALVLPVRRPDAGDQLALWRRELGPLAARLNGAVERVASHFELDATAIRRAAVEVREPSEAALPDRLWNACRREARAALAGLAERIEPRATWDDLVLPAAQKQVLKTIVAQVRQRGKVLEAWGFGGRSSWGLGIHALFAGPSGTGKTLAAEVLARELALDLHRIDLAALVSKYIGETEKNLARVFAAAERGASVLLFDEADALFGRRSEVRDSHDRYANIEVSYLLQRLESYRGLAILTTNLKNGLDPAFARRLRFTVQFPFPDPGLRLEIWKRAFPEATPVEGLDPAKLARLSLSGGHIRNVALNAAFLAAEAGEPVRMRHLLDAAQAEYAKLEKPLGAAETEGWI